MGLHPWLFNIFVGDLDTGLKTILSKFADNSELGGAANSLESRGPAETSQQIREGKSYEEQVYAPKCPYESTLFI